MVDAHDGETYTAEGSRLIWIDCEMTGLDIFGGDELVEVSVVPTDFDLNVLDEGVDYVIKPFSYNDFERKLRRAVAIRGEESASVMIMQRAGTQRVLLRDIEYIEVKNHNLLYHTERGILTGTGTLQDVEDKLGDRGFLRCSKAFVVNGRHVVAVKGNELTLSGGENVTIGRTYRKAFMVALAASMGDGNVM